MTKPLSQSEEETVIRDWLAGQLNPVTGGPLPPSKRLSQPLPRGQVVAVVATLLDLLDAARAAPLDVERLRETAQAVLDELDIIRRPSSDPAYPRLMVHIDTHAALRAALASAEPPE